MQDTTALSTHRPEAAPSPSESPFALRGGRLLSRGELWSDARTLAGRLPDRPQVFNLCEDRYLFCLTLLAAMLRGQICLLPPSGQAGILREILQDYPETYLACEREPQSLPCPWFEVKSSTPAVIAAPVDFDDAQIALVAFTSGSTGRPQPCVHTWGTFRRSASMALGSLEWVRRRWLVVSTTPPQHMYGLETSVFWPLFSELAVYSGRPFFPEDIRRLVESAPLPVLLAATPTHLRSLAGCAGDWRHLAGILSSTAPLAEPLAGQVERTLGAPLREIYGSTETLSFASRRAAHETLWRPYAGARLLRDEQGHPRLIAPHLAQSVGLSDMIGLEADGRFAVLGRSTDMAKIGGKRASLAELNRRLTDLDGVEDGLFYVLEDERGESRMAALVVSRLDRRAIRRALRPYLDEVFLPRRIHFVDAIPRNEVGKVVKAELDRLLEELRSR